MRVAINYHKERILQIEGYTLPGWGGSVKGKIDGKPEGRGLMTENGKQSQLRISEAGPALRYVSDCRLRIK